VDILHGTAVHGSLVLALYHFYEVVALRGGQCQLKGLRLHVLWRILTNLIRAIVVGTRRQQCALWTPVMDKKLTLKVYCRLLQFLEALFFKKFPNLFFLKSLASGNELTFVGVKSVLEAGRGCLVIVPKRRQFGHSERSLVRFLPLLVFLLTHLRY